MSNLGMNPPRRQATTKDAPLVNVAQLQEFDEIIDVRSEDEFAQDHIPGAINCPVLNNAERAQVGTLYKQVSAFDAKRMGAALISANIARHLREKLNTRPRSWKPLLYCWRGGERSGAFAHVLCQVGWRVGRLDGGYKAYRRAVVSDLARLPETFRWQVVCGLTGTGKSRLLGALEHCGAQVLDLEAIAAHRGSVLGTLPDEPQPSQKMFESRLWMALRTLLNSRPVYVEAESRKIGNLLVPPALTDTMWRSNCIVLEAPLGMRASLLKQEYAHFLERPETLVARLECLTGLYGYGTIAEWKGLALSGRWDRLIEELLIKHYDPAYTRSTLKHFSDLRAAPALQLHGITNECFLDTARQCLARAS